MARRDRLPSFGEDLKRTEMYRHEPGFRHGEISGSMSPKTAAYPVAMCEAIASAWYPRAVFGHVPSMPCIPHSIEGGSHQKEKHRERNKSSIDVADIPLWEPSEVLSALVSLAMPVTPAVDPNVEFVGSEAVADLPQAI